MRLRGVADGGLLGGRDLSHGGDLSDPGGALSRLGDTQHGGHVRLLHERHHNGIHRRSGPRRRHRAQQSASANRSRGDENGRLHPREAARRPLRGDHLRVHVGVEHRGYRHDGAHHIRRSARTGASTN